MPEKVLFDDLYRKAGAKYCIYCDAIYYRDQRDTENGMQYFGVDILDPNRIKDLNGCMVRPLSAVKLRQAVAKIIPTIL